MGAFADTAPRSMSTAFLPSLARMLRCAPCLLLAMCAHLPTFARAQAAEPVVVGSKRFTESYILGELARQALVRAGVPAQHRQGLGNTAVMEQALATGSIAVYPEYTGTIVRELLKKDGSPSLEELNTWLAPKGLKAA